MSKKLTFLRYCFVFILSVVSISLTTNAQCVQCTPNPSGWVCTSSLSQPGGTGCRTPDLFTCTLIGICQANSDLSSESCQLKQVKGSYVSISDSIVRDIADKDPRLAVVVLNVRRIGFEFSNAKTSLFSVDYVRSDIEDGLNGVLEPSYSAALAKRVEAARQKDPTILEYRSTIVDSLTGISLDISPTDVSSPKLSLKLEKNSSLLGSGSGYTVTGYDIK